MGIINIVWGFLKNDLIGWVKDNWKIVAIAIGFILIGWMYLSLQAAKREAKFQESEFERQELNYKNKIYEDSIGYSEYSLTQKEFIEEMSTNNSELVQKMEDFNIELKDVKRLISVRNTFTDTVTRQTIITELKQAVKEDKPITIPFQDSTKCMWTKGNLYFDGEDIELNFTERGYSNASDIIAHYEKKQWYKFWKWFSKRKISITVANDCGESITKIIEVDTRRKRKRKRQIKRDL